MLNLQTLLSDKKDMGVKEVFPVIFGVLKDPRVIGTAVVTVVVMEFAKFIANYRKKPAKPKPVKAAPPPKPAESGEEAAAQAPEES